MQMRTTIPVMRAGGQDQPKVFAGTYQTVRQLTVPVTELTAKKPSAHYAHQVAKVKNFHYLVQRDFSGAKKTNAQKELPPYIRQQLNASGLWTGPVWKFDVWLPQALKEASYDASTGLATYEIDPVNMGFLLDGESRCYALETMYLHEFDEENQRALLDIPIIVQLYDGISPERAAQHFADVNGQGVGITPNLLLGHDLRDPWMRVTRKVFADLGIPLEQEARQVKVSSDKVLTVLTVLAVRTMVAAVARGIGAVGYGAGPIPEEVEGEAVNFDRLQDAATQWLRHIFSRWAPRPSATRAWSSGRCPCSPRSPLLAARTTRATCRDSSTPRTSLSRSRTGRPGSAGMMALA